VILVVVGFLFVAAVVRVIGSVGLALLLAPSVWRGGMQIGACRSSRALTVTLTAAFDLT
jgi:hypothetical protein